RPGNIKRVISAPIFRSELYELFRTAVCIAPGKRRIRIESLRTRCRREERSAETYRILFFKPKRIVLLTMKDIPQHLSPFSQVIFPENVIGAISGIVIGDAVIFNGRGIKMLAS